MDKYTILIVLNVPFVLLGYLRAITMYKQDLVRRGGLILRFGFWSVILFGLLFAQNLYDFLAQKNLTNSPPLSLADVVLVTGVVFCLFLTMRAYSKIDHLEKRLSDLHEELSKEASIKPNIKTKR